jgi:hypothetical protein
VNSGNSSKWTPNPENPNVPCPFTFSWEVEEQKDGPSRVISRVGVDSREFISGKTPNLYMGMQENTAIPPVYGGLNAQNDTMVPLLSTVAAITFEMRAKVCYQELPHKGFGRITAYFRYTKFGEHRSRSISVDIMTFLNGHWSPKLPIRRPIPFMDDGTALHIDGGFFGIVPNGTEPMLDNSTDCSAPMAKAPWVAVRLPVQELLASLIDGGYLNASLVDGSRLTGGIVNGVETWGKHWTVSDVRNHTLWLSPSVARV